MTPLLTLDQVRPGQSAIIRKVGGNGRSRRRYMEMGFINGETVFVERIAPLGDPIEYRLKGYHLSLRGEDARQIEVELCPPDCLQKEICATDNCPRQRRFRWLTWLRT